MKDTLDEVLVLDAVRALAADLDMIPPLHFSAPHSGWVVITDAAGWSWILFQEDGYIQRVHGGGYNDALRLIADIVNPRPAPGFFMRLRVAIAGALGRVRIMVREDGDSQRVQARGEPEARRQGC